MVTSDMRHRPLGKRTLVLFIYLLLAALLWTGAAENYRTLETGMIGQDVQALKLRLYELGYYTSDQVSDAYNDLMARRVAQLQAVNGLEQTGVATPDLQAFIYSETCLAANGESLASGPIAAPGETPSPYRTLAQGDAGGDVLLLKQRMYWLGDFNSYHNLSDNYNAVMAERVRQFQQRNGLEATGVATPELQALIYSDQAIPAVTAPTPSPTPAPTAAPMPIQGPLTSPELPALSDDGFLADTTAEPFVFADAQDGYYLYLAQDLAVEIKRYTDPNLTLIWYETEIRLQNGETLQSLLTAKSGSAYRFSTPEALAKDTRAVLAITDDFFGYRMYHNQVPGIIVRNGAIISDKTYK
ncbi:MAG: peptidoglycan-binding protein, partial [Firmicutes bacterium]|nr:peptidoglycan-binding protein [Bacillota bacterium]